MSSSPPRRHIVQCARAIGPGFGVSGPAERLERAFVELGCTCERFTLANLRLRADDRTGAPPAAPVRFWRDVLAFSTLGSLVLWWRFRRRPPGARTVVICHVDALYGDLFVVRSLHRAFLARHPQRVWMLLRNPMHAVVLLRDRIRFRWHVHRHFVALSAGHREEISRLYGVDARRITVIPNGVDLDRFRPSPADRADIRARLSIPAGAFVAIFVGHEFERKGLRVVLEALRLPAARGLRVHLIVAGGDSPGALRDEFGDLADRVHFVGHCPDVERYYAAADVLTLPAAFDISPLVGPEALACGLPILMTDLPGVREYLRDGVNGWFVTREPGDISERLTALAADEALGRRMADAARASVADRDWRAIARRYLELIDRLFPLHVTPGAPPGTGGKHASSADSDVDPDGPARLGAGHSRRGERDGAESVDAGGTRG